jgi:cell wall-associated NlpC family hydrolase
LQSVVQSGGEDFSGPALVAVRFACGQIGKPYVWGGNGSPGFDCSGLTHAAYAAAGIGVPRTAQSQYDAGPLLAAGEPLQPGDLVFFGTRGRIHHVGISLGGTLMVHAPDFGQTVQLADYRSFSDFAGVSRPAMVVN